MSRRAFTMVELVVVVSIISLMASIAAPVLNRTRIAARKAGCALNLHGIALAIANYSADNSGQLMSSSSWWGTGMQVSSIRRRHVDFYTESRAKPWAWNIESINPYVQSFNRSDARAGGLFICPSSQGDYWRKGYYDALNDKDTDEIYLLIATPYAYYARVETWTDNSLHNGAADDLTADVLRADRLLMSDMIQLSRRGRRLYYNHGRRGPSTPGASPLPPASAISGINHLYGDGRVAWKGADELHPEVLDKMSEMGKMDNTFDYPDGFVGLTGESNVFLY